MQGSGSFASTNKSFPARPATLFIAYAALRVLQLDDCLQALRDAPSYI